jgi:hypothetical protein
MTHYAFVEWTGAPDNEFDRRMFHAEISLQVERMRENGVTFGRFTEVNEHHQPRANEEPMHGIWIEGWEEMDPTNQPPFNPPLTTKAGKP